MSEHASIRTTYQMALVGMGHESFEREEYEEALRWYYKAPTIQPAPPYVLEHIVQTLVKLNRVSEAVPHLQRLVDLIDGRSDLVVLLEELRGKLLVS